MDSNMRNPIVVSCAIALGSGLLWHPAARAQTNADLIKMIQELRQEVRNNTGLIQALQKTVQQKDADLKPSLIHT